MAWEQHSADRSNLLRQLRWRSRRGLLELELLLLPFAADCLDGLSAQQLQDYERLLGCEDLDIYDWLQGRSEAPDPSLRDIVRRVSEHQAAGGEH